MSVGFFTVVGVVAVAYGFVFKVLPIVEGQK
jgi:hypothetical protein